ncbi:MAG: DUF4924 family protein [Muribaculaceae bacterium]|nr:DUF4924 family protein [Muribaculaceae bacterium]
MLIAQQKRKENIAEYLLYMWQVEDIIRASGCDIDTIDRNVIARYQLTDAQRAEVRDWWEGLVMMMKAEGVRERGHLQINKNVLIRLGDLHQQLLHSDKHPEYGAEFYRTLPYIVELRAKTPAEQQVGELETCFNALYGVLMLRLQGREITHDTSVAVTQISHFVGLLAAYFKKNEEQPLFAPDN